MTVPRTCAAGPTYLASVNQIFWALFENDDRTCGRFHFYYTKLSDVLVVVNSSCNFVVIDSRACWPHLRRLTRRGWTHTVYYTSVDRNALTPLLRLVVDLFHNQFLPERCSTWYLSTCNMSGSYGFVPAERHQLVLQLRRLLSVRCHVPSHLSRHRLRLLRLPHRRRRPSGGRRPADSGHDDGCRDFRCHDDGGWAETLSGHDNESRPRRHNC